MSSIILLSIPCVFSLFRAVCSHMLDAAILIAVTWPPLLRSVIYITKSSKGTRTLLLLLPPISSFDYYYVTRQTASISALFRNVVVILKSIKSWISFSLTFTLRLFFVKKKYNFLNNLVKLTIKIRRVDIIFKLNLVRLKTFLTSIIYPTPF